MTPPGRACAIVLMGMLFLVVKGKRTEGKTTQALHAGGKSGKGGKVGKGGPQSVEDAWNNHLEAFVTGDAEKIMLDYDAESVLAVFNDACNATTGEYTEYNGDEIKGFFESLFGRLGDPPTDGLVVPQFSSDGSFTNPVVEPLTGHVDDTANVFLVWNNEAKGVAPTTDTFMWKSGYKIKKQNIVTTDTNACTSESLVEQKQTESLSQEKDKITLGWENHLGAFVDKNVDDIMKDYLPTSIIRVFDNNGGKYSEHEGDGPIRELFKGLFDAIRDAAVDGDEGIAVPLLKVEPLNKSVFLVWSSYSHPKATDTFLFDDDGKIVRQNIMVTSQ